MADQNGMNERQRELFIRKSTRVAASYLKRAKELSELPDAAKPFFDVLENTYVNNVKEITKLEGTSLSDSGFTRKDRKKSESFHGLFVPLQAA